MALEATILNLAARRLRELIDGADPWGPHEYEGLVDVVCDMGERLQVPGGEMHRLLLTVPEAKRSRGALLMGLETWAAQRAGGA